MKINNKEASGVRIRNLSLSFDTTEVLKDVNLEVMPGEFFSFLGPSGSGKSTLLRAIAGFGPTPKGQILIGGEDIAKLPPWERNVGMVFQSYALWPHMTVRRNVAFGLEERKIPKAQREERVEAALDLVGLLDYAERRPSQLSGGQQQRVALARTVVIEPKVLLLDEPLSNLDAKLRIQMRQDIRALQRKLQLTTIFVTHDQEEANSTSDRMAVLQDGIIQQVGTPMELYDQPKNLFVANFLGTANVFEGGVEKTGNGTVFRTDRGVALPVDERLAGDCRNVVFRPQNVGISEHGASDLPNHARVDGKVVRAEFLGSIIRYAVETNGEVVQVDSSHQLGSAPFAIGEPVSLQIRRDQIVFLEH
ncbi:ABC transporter ATP-binding protein [Pelagibius sp. CAU 1746]|uniref:ABC transporter ATP-binding protein n=1 Tax=Pelagibius sp. CAU 1746 TaxID=3140370 RepID=UPI00325BAB7A